MKPIAEAAAATVYWSEPGNPTSFNERDGTEGQLIESLQNTQAAHFATTRAERRRDNIEGAAAYSAITRRSLERHDRRNAIAKGTQGDRERYQEGLQRLRETGICGPMSHHHRCSARPARAAFQNLKKYGPLAFSKGLRIRKGKR